MEFMVLKHYSGSKNWEYEKPPIEVKRSVISQIEAIKEVRDLSSWEERELQLASITDELTQLKQISSKALQLDADNRRLVVDSEQLRSQQDMLEAENQRLHDKVDSEDFLNGALAVLLGVIITLVVPRLWPKRRKSSSWA